MYILIPYNYAVCVSEAAKKSYFLLSGPATKRGWGKGCATKEKIFF